MCASETFSEVYRYFAVFRGTKTLVSISAPGIEACSNACRYPESSDDAEQDPVRKQKVQVEEYRYF